METATAIDMRPQILKAIDAGYRTIGQIKHNIGVSPATDISVYLDTMLTDEVIEKNSNGTFTAFYRSGQRVKRMWLEAGRVETEFDEPATRDDKAKAAELGGRAEFNRPFSENGAKMTDNRGPIGKQRAASPDMDLAEVERCAREGMTAKQAAEHFGMTLFVFKNRLTAKTGRFAPVSEAWYRGRKAAGISDRGTKKGERRGPYKSKKKHTAEPIDPMFSETAAGTAVEGGAVAGDVFTSVNEVTAKAKVIRPGDVVTTTPTRRPEFEELDAFVQTVRKRQPSRVHHRHVDLKNGGQIVVGFEGNIFDLTPDEHALITALSTVIAGYETEEENTERE